MKYTHPVSTNQEPMDRIVRYAWKALACSVSGLVIFRALGVIGFFLGLHMLFLMKYHGGVTKAHKRKFYLIGFTAILLGVVDVIIPSSILLTVIPH